MTTQEVESLARVLKYERPQPNWDANKRVQWNLCAKAVGTTVEVYSVPQMTRAVFVEKCGGLFDV